MAPNTTKNGVRLLQGVTNEDTRNLLEYAKEAYSVNFCFQFIEKMGGDTIAYGFALDSANPIQHMELLKELPLLRLFIKRFQEEFKTLYNQLDSHSIDLSSLLGRSYQKMKTKDNTHLSRREEFIKKLGFYTLSSLSSRESEIVRHVVNGYSASQIAALLFLSKRTIEHHIERIKEKTNSSSKSELIQKIRNFELIG